MKNFMIYTGYLQLFGKWNLRGCNGLGTLVGWGRHEIHTEFLWKNLLQNSQWRLKTIFRNVLWWQEEDGAVPELCLTSGFVISSTEPYNTSTKMLITFGDFSWPTALYFISCASYRKFIKLWCTSTPVWCALMIKQQSFSFRKPQWNT